MAERRTIMHSLPLPCLHNSDCDASRSLSNVYCALGSRYATRSESEELVTNGNERNANGNELFENFILVVVGDRRHQVSTPLLYLILLQVHCWSTCMTSFPHTHTPLHVKHQRATCSGFYLFPAFPLCIVSPSPLC